jgi:diacylglycerol kinase (ATP)
VRPPKRALFLANPSASRGNASGVAAEQLRRAGIHLVEATFADGPVAETIARHAADIDAVIVAGGDGSINAAAAGLVAHQLPLGIVPLGTANDLARTLGIRLDLGAACATIAAGLRRRIDVGTANDRYFFNVASIGVSARIARALHGRRKRIFGPLAYAMAALQVLSRARAIHVDIEMADGRKLVTRAMLVSVGNGRRYGGMLTVHATAELDDGILDLVVVQLDRWWRFFPLLPAMLRGRYKDRHPVKAFKVTGAEVRTHAPHSVDLDGEVLLKTPVRFGLLPLAVEVFAPARA